MCYDNVCWNWTGMQKTEVVTCLQQRMFAVHLLFSKSAFVYLPEDEGAHEDAGHGGIRPGVPIQ